MLRNLPPRHSRRNKSHNPNAHAANILDDVRPDKSIARRINLLQIRRQPRKIRFPFRLPHFRQPKIKFMIPHSHSVVMHLIKSRNRRILRLQILHRKVISQRRPLRSVAAIQQKQFRRLRPLLFHQSSNLRQRKIRSLIRVVVNRLNMPMNIGGRKQSDRLPRSPRSRRRLRNFLRPDGMTSTKQPKRKSNACEDPRASVTNIPNSHSTLERT